MPMRALQVAVTAQSKTTVISKAIEKQVKSTFGQ